MRQLFLALCLALLAPLPAAAQATDTLADIRQELQVLLVEIQRLNRELSTTGGAGGGVEGGSLLERVDLIEAELARLTAKTEELEFRIDQVVRDGTNRIGDLNFRLCELEPGCDIATLPDTPTLGGGPAPETPSAPVAPPAGDGGAELAMGEQADFDRAKAAFDAGDFADAAAQFQRFTETYLGGPLAGEAHFWRGRALDEQEQTADAARAYLESFSGSPDGPRAPAALYRLGLSLDTLGQRAEACVTLGEVSSRYPGTRQARQAEEARARLSCQ